MPRNRDVCTVYLSYLLRMCDVCVAYPLLSFRIYGVSATYVWRISRINGICATYVLLLWSMCDVLEVLGIFVAFQENLNASIYMFSFFRRCFSRFGVPKGYTWCSLCLCSCLLTTRMGSLEVFPPPTTTTTTTTSAFFLRC